MQSETKQIETLAFGAEKGYCKAMQGYDMAIQKALSSQNGFGKTFLKARWGRGCCWVHDQIMHNSLKNEDHGIWSHHLMANRWGNRGNSERPYFLGLQNHCRWWLQPWNYKTLAPWKKSCDQPKQHIKKQRHYFANKGPSNQSYGFSRSSCMDVRVGPERKLIAEELMLLNCGVGEDSRVPWTARRSSCQS